MLGVLFLNACSRSNKSAEGLYGYSAAEPLGRYAEELLTDAREFDVAYEIDNRIRIGERWLRQFPKKTKIGNIVLTVPHNTPFYDYDGTLV